MEPVLDSSVELQIVSRAQRMGAPKGSVIEVHRLAMRGTIEETMLQLEGHLSIANAVDTMEHYDDEEDEDGDMVKTYTQRKSDAIFASLRMIRRHECRE